jgi:hypothetical protein
MWECQPRVTQSTNFIREAINAQFYEKYPIGLNVGCRKQWRWIDWIHPWTNPMRMGVKADWLSSHHIPHPLRWLLRSKLGKIRQKLWMSVTRQKPKGLKFPRLPMLLFPLESALLIWKFLEWRRPCTF